MRKSNRIISLLLVLIMMCAALSSCSQIVITDISPDDGDSGSAQATPESNNGDDIITKGDLLLSIYNEFGMPTYNDDEEYFSDIPAGNEYFAAVQSAVDWGIISKSDSLDVDDTVTTDFAAITLANATGMLSEDSSDNDKIQWAMDNDVISGSGSEEVTVDDAREAVDAAKKLWAHIEYEQKEEVEYLDGVVDLSAEKFDYEMDGKRVIIPSEYAENIKSGTIYVLPATDEYYYNQVFEAKSVKVNGNNAVITNTDKEPDIEDIAEEFFSQDTYAPDLTECVATDANGDPLNSVNYASQKPKYSSLGFNTTSPDEPLCVQTISKKAGKADIDAVITSSEVSCKVTYKIGGITMSAECGAYGIQVSHEIDYSLFSGLKSVRLAMDYETREDYIISGSYTYDTNKKFEYNYPANDVIAELRQSVDSNDSSGEDDVLLASIPIAHGGIAKLAVDVSLHFEISGKIQLVFSTAYSKGIEYKKGNIRTINDKNASTPSLTIDADAKLMVALGLNAYILGKNVAGFSAAAGIGMKVTSTTSLVDQYNHLFAQGDMGSTPAGIIEDASSIGGITANYEAVKAYAESQGGVYNDTNPMLHLELCLDVVIYPTASLYITDSLLKTALDWAGVTTKWSFDGLDNPLISAHIDELSDLSSWSSMLACVGSECRKEFVPFDKPEETPETSPTPTPEPIGTYLDIKEYSITLEVGSTGKIEITNIPNGYEMSDLVFESEDSNVASVSSDGTVTGNADGVTTITIHTSDNEYTVSCMIIVNEY